MKKTIFVILLLIVLVFSGVVFFSPYRKDENYQYKLVKHTVFINGPVDSVFRFLGNSAYASKWSVFVDHIIPLNTDSFPDGLPGCRRRCYKDSAEAGIKWDELITVVKRDTLRQITIYNAIGFLMMADGLATEQRYEVIDVNKCRLTFTYFS